MPVASQATARRSRWCRPALPLQEQGQKHDVQNVLILRFGSASVNNLCKTGENQRVFNTFVRKVLIYLAFSRLCQSVRQRADPKSRYWPHFLGRVGAAGWINWRVLRAIVFYQKHSENLEFSSLLQKAQLILVKLLASDDPQVRQIVRDRINIDLFSEPILKKLAGILLPLYEDIKYSAIIDQFENKQQREIVTKLLMEDRPQEDPEKEISDCMNILKSNPVKEKIKAARFKIRELEQRGDDPTDAVIEEAQLQQELRDLK